MISDNKYKVKCANDLASRSYYSILLPYDVTKL